MVTSIMKKLGTFIDYLRRQFCTHEYRKITSKMDSSDKWTHYKCIKCGSDKYKYLTRR